MRWLTTLLLASALIACGGEGGETTEGKKPLEAVMDVPGANATLNVRIHGELEAPKTVVFLHDGPGLSHAYMEPLINGYVTSTTRVVVYDQRGMGDSSPAPPSFLLTDYAFDLEAIRGAVRAGSMHLVAHGWGGLVAWSYLASYPDRVASLTLINGWAPVAQANSEALVRVDDRVTVLQLGSVIPTPLPPDVGDDCAEAYKARLPAYMFNPDTPPPGELLQTQCRRSVQLGTLAAIAAGYDFVDAAIAFTGPSFILFGKNTPLGAELGDVSNNVMVNSPHAYNVVPAAGHYAWLEIADFESQMNTFVAGLP